MEDSQVNGGNAGDQGAAADGNLGWRSALPDEFKEHEFVKTFSRPGDFVKSALEIKTEHEALKTRMGEAIFKPGENATQEEKEAFYRALGKPEKAAEYEFPKTEGIEHDPKFVEWAQTTFHQAHLGKEQAAIIGKSWDQFMSSVTKAQQEAAEKAKEEATAKLKADLGDEYPAACELTKRMFRDHATPEELAILEESGVGNNPALIRLIFNFAKKTGEDTSPQAGKPGAEPPRKGFVYDKSPAPSPQ